MTHRLVLRNSGWLIADKIVRLGLGLIVWLWLARQVGPEAFGEWNFAIAFAALFSVVAGVGLDGVVQRELAAGDSDVAAILGTAATLRIAFGVAAALLCVAAALIARRGDPTVIALVALNAAVFVLQSSQVIDYLFQARMNNRPAVLAVNVAFIAATAVRLAMLVAEAPLLWFGATLVLEGALAAALLVTAARAYGMPVSAWRFDARIGRHLLAESWPMLLSGITVVVYMRIDQVMLATMVGDGAVGQFAAALRISEVWYFVPAAILSAAFPAMIARRSESKEAYTRYVQHLYDVMAWLGLAVAVLIAFTSTWLMDLLYGPAYAEASHVLSIQIWAGVAVAMSYVHGKWLLAEGLQRLNLIYTATGCMVNLALNVLLIPKMGASGAAWATLATQVGVLPMQLLFRAARPNFWLMMNAIVAPYRWSRALSRRRHA